jgi:hypothetical protein
MNNVSVLESVPILVEECCGNCKHICQWPNGALKCHRNPPTALILAGKTLDGNVAHLATLSDWAPVRAEQSCGEYRRKILVDQ